MLETLGSNETLDLGSFGVGFFAFGFGLDFAADDEFADLSGGVQLLVYLPLLLRYYSR